MKSSKAGAAIPKKLWGEVDDLLGAVSKLSLPIDQKCCRNLFHD